ncbi:MAG: hypothetical protein IPL46_24945 [Saprospiraceae bacterium]|nr:hypothetical protein [Saprospiraceae bacterium]
MNAQHRALREISGPCTCDECEQWAMTSNVSAKLKGNFCNRLLEEWNSFRLALQDLGA